MVTDFRGGAGGGGGGMIAGSATIDVPRFIESRPAMADDENRVYRRRVQGIHAGDTRMGAPRHLCSTV